MKSEGYRTVLKPAGSEIFREFFREYTTVIKVSKKLRYRVFGQVSKFDRNGNRILSKMFSRKGRKLAKSASRVMFYWSIWYNEYKYLEMTRKPGEYEVLTRGGKNPKIIKKELHADPHYRGSLKPFYEWIEDKFKISFSDNEKKVIEFFFELPEKRNLNPDINPLDDIKNRLIDFVIGGTDYLHGGLQEWTGFIKAEFKEKEVNAIIEKIGGYILNNDEKGFINYVQELDKVVELKTHFERNFLDLYLVLFVNRNMIGLIEKLVSIAPAYLKNMVKIEPF